MANKANKRWGVAFALLVGVALAGCTSAQTRPSVTTGHCQYFDNGGGLALISASGLREGQVVHVGLYDPKVPTARVMVEHEELTTVTKVKLGIDPNLHALPRNPGDPLHANFFLEERWNHRILGFIPDPRKTKIWFGLGCIDGATIVQNDPTIQALGYCLEDTEVGPERAKHLEHAPGFGPEPAPARRFRQPSVARK